jgi:hypothetical protein
MGYSGALGKLIHEKKLKVKNLVALFLWGSNGGKNKEGLNF